VGWSCRVSWRQRWSRCHRPQVVVVGPTERDMQTQPWVRQE
jgi:hypothetical protein